MKKIFSMLLVLALALGGCGSTTENGTFNVADELTEPVTIEFWHTFSGEVEATLQEITDEFNEQNDMVEVKLQAQGTYSDLQPKLVASKEARTLPVLSVAYASWDDLWGSVENLTPYAEISGYEMDFDNFVPAFLEEVTNEDGNVYGLPYNKSTDVLFYNKDLAKEAGIDKAPENLDELFEDAKLITEKTGVVGIGYDSLQNYLATAMISEGVSWVDEEGYFQFDDPAVETEIQMFQDGINEGYARVAGEDGYFSDIMASEKVAAYIGSSAGASWMDSAINDKFEWGAIPIPFEKAPQQGTNIVIYSESTPEEKLAAWEYLNFLYEDENIVKFALASGYMPTTLSAIDTDEYAKAMENDEVAKATTDSIDKMEVTIPSFAGASEIFTSNIATSMSKIFDNGEDVDTVLKALNEEAKAIYDRNN